MILNGCFLRPVTADLLSHKNKTYSFRSSKNSCVSPHFFNKVVFNRSPWKPPNSSGIKSSPLSNIATAPLLIGQLSHLPNMIRMCPHKKLQQKRHSLISPKASPKDTPFSYRYPPMKKRPKWWWRTLACLPYLMPLHGTWMTAETAYHLHPFLESFEFLTYPFWEVVGRQPVWFGTAYFMVAYLGIVRRKEWPHFFRFHVVNGMLLDICLQVVGSVKSWMPLAMYWGKFGMHLWTAFAFGFLFTVLECIRCALAGMYADIPFVCDAAYIQIPYE